ncbi:metalloendoproteinase 5-MMP-like [Impatiens glandulifera]|uniref:metalloendoproteinase 5-MMP-like n=1 Tax=Impatiens glandulifera TaxID=253017 RepID=UPI001FB11BFA|nr:metalloendoproteinase 5-MMP-like [Impatiens glandulifera]
MVNPQYGFPDLVSGSFIKDGVKLVRDPFIGGSYYELGSSKFSSLYLTWALPLITKPLIVNCTVSALRKWASQGVPFNFVRIYDILEADIKISFVSGDHGDGLPFNGKHGPFGHGLPPPTGILHLNEDIPWAMGAVPGTVDIETVVLHMLGHVLGLSHSNVSSAVMWAHMQWGLIKRDLDPDDIVGIRTLYGYRDRPRHRAF